MIFQILFTEFNVRIIQIGRLEVSQISYYYVSYLRSVFYSVGEIRTVFVKPKKMANYYKKGLEQNDAKWHKTTKNYKNYTLYLRSLVSSNYAKF